MSYYIHYKDPYSPEIVKMLESIPKTPGICIFMDINRSTDLKYTGGVSDWGRRLNNTFNFLLYSNHFEKDIVKGIGDEMMLYIPDDELKSKASDGTCFALLEDIYSSLYNIRNHPDPGLFLDCKVSIHYCTEVYSITFFEGVTDYYGSDIDLTARLMTKSVANRIVLSDRFLGKVKNDLQRLGMPENTGCLEKISERFLENFKGVPVSTEYRFIDVE